MSRFRSVSPVLTLSLLGSCLMACCLSGCASPPPEVHSAASSGSSGYEWPPRSSYGSGEVYRADGQTGPSADATHAAGKSIARPTSKRTTIIREPESEYSAPLPYIRETGTPKPTAAPMMPESACLSELEKRGVEFERLESLRGVETPIEVKGELGGVTFWTDGGRRLQMDCRLALALDRLRYVFAKNNVTRARYSGAYVYRTTRSGRLSHHAHGLAIDLHSFTISGQRVDLEGDFTRNVGCREGVDSLNRLSCDLRETAVFDEFLTPDYNYDHRDHLHISVPRR